MRIAPTSAAFTILLGILAALPALSIDISAPTLQLLPAALRTSTTVAGLTLSLFMAGFALGQVSGGGLSDRIGRKPVLLGGLACYTAAGVACALAPNGPALVIARFIQGLGAGACSVLSFAVVQDWFEGDAARTKRAYVTVVFGVVPVLAPALGALLSNLAGWRAVHGILALAGGLLLAVTWRGIAESRRARPSPAPDATSRLRDDSQFIGLALANALSYGAIFTYIAGSPIIIIGQMGLSSMVFAAIFAGTALALTAGAWASGRLSRQGYAATALLNHSLGAATVAALALTVASLTGVTSGMILVPLLLVVLFTRGTIAPNLQHLAMERRQEQAGVASAAIGVSQLLSGALTSAVVAVLLPHFGASAVAIPMALLAAAALVIWYCIRL